MFFIIISIIILFILSFYIPTNIWVCRILTAIGTIPMAYFYIIKYYYKDHAGNIAGAFISLAVMCSVILLDDLKKYKIGFIVLDILEHISIFVGVCFALYYGSKVSALILIGLLLLSNPNLLKKTIFRTKLLYCLFSVVIALSSVFIFLLTKGSHKGLVALCFEGNLLQFIIINIILYVYIFFQYDVALKNKSTTFCFSSIISLIIMLQLEGELIRTPFIVYIFILGYSIRFFGMIEKEEYNQSEKKYCAEYSNKDKWIIALILSFEFALSILILAPLEIYSGNMRELYFGLADFLPVFILTTMILSLAMTVILRLISNHIFPLIMYIVLSLEVCMYAQVMFMNIKLYEFNGTNMNWEQIKWFYPINIVIWVGIFVVVFRLYKTEYQKALLKYLGAFLVIVQTVAIVSLIPTVISSQKKSIGVFSSENQFKVAKNENIIIFIVDALGRGDLEECQSKYPDIIDQWHDFTEYTNANSDYCNTYPSIAHMITGYEYEESNFEYLPQAWKSERNNQFFDYIHNKGFVFNLYTSETAHIGSYEDFNEKIDNAKIENPKIDKIKIFKLLLTSSLYRSCPYVIKPYLEVPSYMFDKVADFSSPCEFMNSDYYAKLSNDGLGIADQMNNQIMVTHIQGYHNPFCNDEHAQYLNEASREQALRGVVYLLNEYLNKLKQIGKYDDSTIIITADHAYEPRMHPQPIFFIKKKNEHHDLMKYSSAPIRHGDFQGTIVKLIDSNNNQFGNSIFDFKEDEVRTRTLEGQDWGWNDGQWWHIEYAGDENDAYEELRKNKIIE